MLTALALWLHVLAMIVALGSNITYGVWIRRARKHPESLGFTLQGIQWIDNRMANPAYVVLLVTGLGMAHGAGIPLTTPWLFVSLVLFVIVAILGLAGYTPTLRAQIRTLEREGAASPRFQALERRAKWLGMALGVLTLAISYFMVVKPL